MGFGALIGAGISAAGSIAGSMLSSSGGGGVQAQAGQYAGALKKTANQYLGRFTDSKFWDINAPDLAAQALDFGIQEAPVINQANMAQLQTLLHEAMPGWQNMWGQMRANTDALLTGAVPQDVQDQIRRSAAYTSVMGGTAGAGTGTSGAITARDLGLTSLQLQQQGQGQATNLLSFARNYLMPQPVNPMSLLPVSDMINASEWSKSAEFQANEAMYTAIANAYGAQFSAPPTPSSAPSTVGAISGGLSSLFTPGPSGQSPFSSLFGGGGGGNANPNFSLSYGDYQAQQMGYSSYAAATAAGAI